MNKPVIRGEKICKDFSGVRVLSNINIEGYPGVVHGIGGENGAGKTTLMNILSGFLSPTEGKIFFQEKEVVLTPQIAKGLGIALIPQELNLVETLPVYQNIFLGKEIIQGFRLNRKYMIKESHQILSTLGLSDLDPRELVENLSTAQKQLVEIAKSILEKTVVLIMDEPTSSLAENEIQTLFQVICSFRERGACIFFVSHRLKEVKEICDRITILRDGNKVITKPTEGITEEDIARLMVGRTLESFFPPKQKVKEQIIMEVRDLSDGYKLKKVSFIIHQGEILGLAGLMGVGRTELAECIIGLRPKQEGQIFLEGKEVFILNPEDAKKLGIVYLPEERKSAGIIASMSVAENISLMVLEKIGKIFINRKEEEKIALRQKEELQIRCRSIWEPIEFLSGGNQQKVVFARLMEVKPKIYLLDEPTRGIDVNTKMYIYHLVRRLSQEGISFLFISSELPEIVGLCDRVAVMYNGEIVSFLEGEEVNEEEIMVYATGLRREKAYVQ